MSGRHARDDFTRTAKGVMMAGLLAALLGACGIGGDSQAASADEKFKAIEYVVDASTMVNRPGLPTNTAYFSQLELQGDLSLEDEAQAIDRVIVVARDALAPTATGDVALHFYDDVAALDLRNVLPLLGDLGSQSPANTGAGDLVVTKQALAGYESPYESR